MNINLLQGDCLEQMKQLPDNSVDSIVTDPPYGISFMSKKWDYDVPKVEVWKEAMRVLKHGGHALIACGTRTQHRMVVNIEDAGFEIRDVVSWIYGSGFPKSLNVSKAIDKAAGAEREVVGSKVTGRANAPRSEGRNHSDCAGGQMKVDITAPATEAAKQWDGWGTALKPACEFFTLARKPLSEKTVAANVLKWGTGGINIDGCRVGTTGSRTNSNGKRSMYGGNSLLESKTHNDTTTIHNQGRFPANLIHDGSQQVLELFPETNKGFAARFFYCPKASKKDRDEGLEGFEEKKSRKWRDDKGMKLTGSGNLRNEMSRNTHPTVKPTALMQYLCRLITPTGGVVLDPYMGSGSTGKAAVKEGFSFVGCELDEDYYKIATARIETAK
jgi:site-specific DNA-methyltransferase (adenine-specific)